MPCVPNARPHAIKVASASSRVWGFLSGARLSSTCGTAHGAKSPDAHIAPRSVAASCSLVTRMESPGGGRKDTGK